MNNYRGHRLATCSPPALAMKGTALGYGLVISLGPGSGTACYCWTGLMHVIESGLPLLDLIVARRGGHRARLWKQDAGVVLTSPPLAK